MATGTRIPTWTFGERLAKAREDADLTQEEVAEKFGVGHATIAKWERNKAQPRDIFTVVARWSEITGVSEIWLMHGERSEMRGSSTRSKRKARGGERPGNARPGGATRPVFDLAAGF